MRTSNTLLITSGQNHIGHHFNYLTVQWAHVRTQALLSWQGRRICLVCSSLIDGAVGSGRKISAPLFVCEKDSTYLSCHTLKVHQSFHWVRRQWTWRDPNAVAVRTAGSLMCYGDAYLNNRIQAAHLWCLVFLYWSLGLLWHQE